MLAGTTGAPPAGAAGVGGALGKVSAKVRERVAAGGTATFWVMLRGSDDLAAARKARGKAKAAAVLRDARAGAAADQAGLRRLLTGRKAAFRSFWIADTMQVTGDAALLAAIAGRPEVKAVLPDEPVRLPVARAAAVRQAVEGAEWNVDRIGAPRVWAERGVTGAGIVVANVDSGVQFDHPALAAGYRGRAGDHDYHWFDPAGICPGGVPCDNTGHGTHTMGTMAGAGGVGVAPGATWIAAKGCENTFCSVAALLAAGQWIVAPTDRNGLNPRPDLAPDIVNNSWGGAAGFDPWYAEIVRAWVAAGIFPAFSNGNGGPGCATAGSPGSYADTYATGATDVNDAIAGFSSRGGGQDGAVKPDIAAPGVDVRSSVPDGYAAYSGTSMASPHTAGTVALIWSAVPGLRRNIAATREILGESAIDTGDTACGGTAGDNNVFGQGRLDAHAAVALAAGPAGSLAGTVTSGGFPLAGATVRVDGPVQRTLTSAADGGYRFGRLPAGDYRLRVSAFGYDPVERDVTVTADGSVTAGTDLPASAAGVVTGTVTSGGTALPGVTVALSGTPVTVTSDDAGRFRLAAPLGDYELTARPLGGCSTPVTRRLRVSGDHREDLDLPQVTDRSGYRCGPATDGYRAGDRRLDLAGDDSAAEVTLPFAFPLYSQARSRAWVGSNGLITFGAASLSYTNTALPDAAEPNDALYPFWDDIFLDDRSSVWTSAGPDTFVVEWRDVTFFLSADDRLSVSAVLHADGTVTYRYRGLSGPRGTGISATIGLENAGGTDGLAYAHETPAVTDGSGVTFRPPHL
ncbi:peptidase S8 [Paractinoplanes rishiriensis]|uniref:Peptidase S8 n=1 Tax=Paractinoplanes rishiriensis TaxID=1050105 RepID=A0A919K5N2_9ACTN|nr:peptidase S8 [Actinoplanes rishiriensis]